MRRAAGPAPAILELPRRRAPSSPWHAPRDVDPDQFEERVVYAEARPDGRLCGVVLADDETPPPLGVVFHGDDAEEDLF